MKSPIRRYAPVIIWSGVIFALSSLPSTPAPETWWNFVLKKGAHVTEYAILYWLAWRAGSDPTSPRLRGAMEREAERSYLAPLLFTILYAISDEIHQSFVPGRHGRWYDVVVFDTIGALLALQLLRRRYLRNLS